MTINHDYSKPSLMTRQKFEELANQIRERASITKHEADYDRWEDAEGNWYVKTDGGFSKTIFYAGTEYFLNYSYVPGQPMKSSISVWEYLVGGND